LAKWLASVNREALLACAQHASELAKTHAVHTMVQAIQKECV